MNKYSAKSNYKMYSYKGVSYVLDASTGTSYAVEYAFDAAPTAEDMQVWQGKVGYLQDKYHVWRIIETGECFMYPFSHGWADPEEFKAHWAALYAKNHPVTSEAKPVRAEMKHLLDELIADMQPADAPGWHQGLIMRDNFTFGLVELASLYPITRQLVKEAIELGEKTFRREWQSSDMVFFYDAKAAHHMRTKLETIREAIC